MLDHVQRRLRRPQRAVQARARGGARAVPLPGPAVPLPVPASNTPRRWRCSARRPPKLRARLEGMTDEGAKKKLEARIESVANHADTEDIGTEDEKLLGEIVAEVHGQDFYIIDKFPSNVRPFYTMPDPVDPNFSNSCASGRVSDPAAGARPTPPPHPIPPSQVRYLHPRRGGHVRRPADPRPADAAGARRDGAARRPHADPGVRRLVQVRRLPHAGGGIGLERVVMLFLGLPNIRKSSMFPRDPRRPVLVGDLF